MTLVLTSDGKRLESVDSKAGRLVCFESMEGQVKSFSHYQFPQLNNVPV